MGARAYGVARITEIPKDAGEHTPAGDLNPARGLVLGLGVSVMLWVLLAVLFFVSVF